MNAVGVYVQTAQLLLRSEPTNGNSIEQFNDLNRLLGHLRQLLACAVCSRLLSDPFAPRERSCQHNVCRLCIRGRKCLRPPCVECKECQDFRTYVENPQMRCLLLCFKSLCEHVVSAQPLFQQLCRQKQSLPAVVSSQPSTVPVSQMSMQEYILEGANYSDITSAFTADLPRSTPLTAIPRLHIPQSAISTVSPVPPLATSAGVTSLMPISALNLLAQTQNAPKAATPPTCVMSNIAPNSIVIKQERNSITTNRTPPPPLPLPPPLSIVNNSTFANINQSQPQLTALSSQSMCIKNFVKQSPSLNTPATASAPIVPTFTYVGPNTPSVVVPIVSSSTTTNAPLSIASSRLQSINRQLAQARRTTTTTSATSVSNDAVPPLAFKVSLTPTSSVALTNTATVTTTATATTPQVRNPPPIKTVSNGSAMYSVLYTGIGNKITIKRKTDGDEDVAEKKSISTSTNTSLTPSGNTVYRQVMISKPTNQNKRRGCRCGNATPTPGKLTCCGQRCPCYVDSKSCIGCKCRGCRNPHRPDGGKVRPVIPELACYEIQMADESSSLSPSDPPIATVTTTLPVIKNTIKQHVQHQQPLPQQQQQPQQPQQQQPHQLQTLTHFEDYKPPLPTQLNLVSHLNAAPSNSTNKLTQTATLIPFKTLHTTSSAQNLQPQQLQRIGTLNTNLGNSQLVSAAISTSSATNTTTTNMMQLENLQRESVLIQNSDGNYQVVNLFTTGVPNTHAGNSTQMSLQRFHTISGANTITTTSTNAATGGLQQIILQQQQQHQQHQAQQRQHHLAQRINNVAQTPSPSPPTPITSTTMTMTTSLQQLQQQLKQNNLITMHSIATNLQQQQQHQHQQQQQQQQHRQTHNMATTTPLISPSATSNATTITLSPIIVTSPNTLTTDMFSSSEGSSDEFISINNLTSAAMAAATSSPNISNGSSSTTHLIALPTPNDSSQFSTISIDGIDGSSNTMLPTGIMAPTTAHLTPALVEVIDSNELHAFQANGFSYN